MTKSGTVHRDTFRRGSRTYYNSTRFFPRRVRDDVFILYGFVRVADDYVDRIPQDRVGFEQFVTRYRRALRGDTTGDPIVDSFVELARRRSFDPDWTDAFLQSMRMDLEKSVHATLPETLEYVYGSAEVIGLFMARLLELDRAAEEAACMLGRAMQFINFIRDIREDNELGRIYLPISETSLPDLTIESARRDPQEFERFLRAQLQRYREWQDKAEKGYAMIPRRYRIPIKTAGDMYNWTGRVIARNPYIVFQRKVKPAHPRIITAGLINAVFC
ncbi:MAG: phytoene/squalene synthase family protein [Spirochaetaceae bacterium]|nr:MAG: phytoene/squalene synthase family protein [Spirochaetaceae bacterium]